MTDQKIVAFGLLSERDLRTLGPSFSRAWPVDEKPCFAQLVRAIDEADAALGGDGGAEQPPALRSVESHQKLIGEGRR